MGHSYCHITKWGALLPAVYALSQSCTAVELAQGEKIKEFIEHPPAIKRILFEVVYNNNFPRIGSVLPRSKKFSACVQGQSFLLRPVRIFAELTNVLDAGWPERVILGSTETSSWSLRYPDLLLDFPTNCFRSVSLNGGFISERATYRNLEGILNLGITAVPIGAVHWQGDTFSVPSDIAVDGQLVRTNERVGGMLITHSTTKETFHYILSYEYAPAPLLGYLPTKITRSLSLGTNTVLDRIFILHSIELAEARLPVSAFSSEPFYKLAKRKVVSKGKQLFDTSGKLLIPSIDGKGLSGPAYAKQRLGTFVFLISLFTAGIYLWWKKENAINKRQQKETT